MIAVNILSRVLHLRAGNRLGTCFCVEVGDKQYWITAKHVLANVQDLEQQLFVSMQGEWVRFPSRLIGHADQGIDVSVFNSTTFMACHPVFLAVDQCYVGQDMHFLGYPFGISTEAFNLNRGFPIPLVKRAMLSGMVTAGKMVKWYLDGHNNEGFSGGPVVYRKAGVSDTYVGAVVSGYRAERRPVYTDKNSDMESGYTTEVNTGIIEAYTINHALDLILANPTGLPVPAGGEKC